MVEDSESVKVTVVVSPAFNDNDPDVIAIFGAVPVTSELLVTEVLLRSDTSFPELSWIALVSSPEVGSF